LLRHSSDDGDKLVVLHKHASETASLIREKASDNTVLLASHFDADGISAGSIMLSAVNRLTSLPHLRIIDSINERILDEIESIESDLVIFTDIGSGYLEIISKILRNRNITSHWENLAQTCTTSTLTRWGSTGPKRSAALVQHISWREHWTLETLTCPQWLSWARWEISKTRDLNADSRV
jgi:hypothetical protein